LLEEKEKKAKEKYGTIAIQTSEKSLPNLSAGV
jgi:hypothetical protein